MSRLLTCWLFGHKVFHFPNGTEVCRRCFRWWEA